MNTALKQWKVLKSEEEYKAAMERTIEIFHAEDDSEEADELDLLLVLVKDFEDKHVLIPTPDPLEVIKLKLNEKGLKMKDLEPIIGSKGHVSSVLSGKRDLTLKMVKKLHEFLGIPAQVFVNSNQTVKVS